MVKELKVKLGDKVREGSVVLTVEGAAGAAAAEVSASNTAPAPAVPAQAAPKTVANAPAVAATPAPAGASYAGTVDLECDLLVLGADPGREAVLNALVHRDYAVTAPVQIRVYEDRLRTWNPAVLPEGWGRGVERIFAACRAAGVPEPVLRYEPNDMWLEFAFGDAYLKVLGARQKLTDQVPPGVEAQVTEQVGRLIAVLNEQTLSLQELMMSLGLSHRPNFIALYLRPALDAKYLQMTVPDKPNSRLQKYTLTALGRQWLNHRNKA
ncbi:MAG: hypothetical protein A3F78_12235 [Burkholderiales bacterium RIFCSPLOWO2_12_FULL_61_40]|nr:MAG: hypothetical protein A3F78_12235 [Burkholderiales bacterium RIFCSPLOWO2_12_FULL_61_40]